MEISRVNNNVVSDRVTWKDMVVAGMGNMIMDGLGMPVILATGIGRSIGRDVLNLVKGKEIPKSLAKFFADTAQLTAISAMHIGTYIAFIIPPIYSFVRGAAAAKNNKAEEMIETKMVELCELEKRLDNINDKRGFFVDFL